MKKILLLLVFIVASSLLFAQQNYQDVVYLKNGSIIHGIIIEQIPNKSIKIETTDKNVFVYQVDEIERLTKELMQVKSNYSKINSGTKSGYQCIVETGNAFGVGTYGMDFLKINIINGYRINPYLSFGVGTGLRYYYDAKSAVIPIFTDFRVNFINKRISPYFALGTGYSFNSKNDFEGVGLLLSPTTGIKVKLSSNIAMNIGIGYEMQEMEFYTITTYYSHHYPYHSTDESESKEISGCISLNVGILF